MVGLAVTGLLSTTALIAPVAASAAPEPTPPTQSSSWLDDWDPTTLTITDTLSALENGDVSSVELVEAFTDRIDTYEPYYNAFTQMNDAALKDAKKSDKRRANGKKTRALEGVPIVIKDSMDVKGMPTTSGWPLTAPIAGGLALVPEEDAPAVARLRKAGAIIIGKTNLPILAGSGSNANNSAYGPTYNSLNQAWAPGGSSSGSATSVSGGFAVTGMAEETGGSIQNPASAQSLYAVKPTFGLVPNTGNFPLQGITRDVLGPLAKSPEDAAIMMDVLAGYSPDDPKTEDAEVPEGGYAAALSTESLEGKRIGLWGDGWRTGSNAELSPETAELYAQAVDQLEAQGATVVPDPFAGSGFDELRGAGGATGGGNNWAIQQYLERLGPSAAVNSVEELNAWADANGFEDDERVNRMLEGADEVPDLSPFLENRDEYLRIYDAVMEDQQLDALVYPQQVREVGPIFSGSVSASTVSEINVAQLPGVVVPDGAYASGKPFNLIILGEKWSEADLLSYAYDYADAYGGRILPELGTVEPDTTDPTVTVKPESVGKDGVYSTASFKLYDAGMVAGLELNGVEKDLTDNTWSDLNGVVPGAFGGVEGENELEVFDVFGNSTTVEFTLDATAPTVTVKDGASFTEATDDGYAKVSFKLHDALKIDKAVINGTVKDLSDNAWSDVNFVKPGTFGAVAGLNTVEVYDVAGNVTAMEVVLE
ncbi:amidase family protein [Cellulosimicrobium arenosum]|uniref:Amidase n=1 Tax=Cellulosimicrobium arenosum TaxID=2708133 RepID=A0A927J248_9MICO|nr:amidase [Cellulosimicrobium arenosum]